MADAASSQEPIDLKEALSLLDDDEELLQQCFKDYFENAPEMIDDIAKAVSAGAASELANAAHRFKGTLKYLAATNAANLAYELEMLGDKGELANVATVLATLKEECKRVEAFMSDYIKAATK